MHVSKDDDKDAVLAIWLRNPNACIIKSVYIGLRMIM